MKRPHPLMTHLLLAACALLAVAVAVPGCASQPVGPYSSEVVADRHTSKADELNTQAADLIDSDPKQAEKLLREALTADLYHGPAHNNLGALFLKQGRLYEAAQEFEWAKRLMPGHPDPRLNLALTLEIAGRSNEAIDTYKTALEVYPDHIPTLEALTRIQVRTNKRDPQTLARLNTIALQGETQAWRDWARLEAARTAGDQKLR